MPRALNADEKLRYPWATRINDYVPVGPVRRAAMIIAGVGFGLFLLVAIVFFVGGKHLHLAHGIPQTGLAWATYGPAIFLMLAAGVVGLVTFGQAVAKSAHTAMLWSLIAVLPAVLWVLLVLR